MNTPVRVLLDIAFRSVAVLVLSKAVAAIYAAAEPNDDGLGTGLTAMFVLVCAAVSWGLWDGFHRSPVPLCVTWVMTGIAVSLGRLSARTCATASGRGRSWPTTCPAARSSGPVSYSFR